MCIRVGATNSVWYLSISTCLLRDISDARGSQAISTWCSRSRQATWKLRYALFTTFQKQAPQFGGSGAGLPASGRHCPSGPVLSAQILSEPLDRPTTAFHVQATSVLRCSICSGPCAWSSVVQVVLPSGTSVKLRCEASGCTI